MDEIVVYVSLRLPKTDRNTMSGILAPLMQQAVATGGDTVNISIHPYNPEEENE